MLITASPTGQYEDGRCLMIRDITFNDIPDLEELARAIDLFEPHELEMFSHMLHDHFNTRQDNQHWIIDDDNTPLGAAYYAPEPFSKGVWNLYFIGVHPQYQGYGRGSALLTYIEQSLMERGERLLLVETSGMERFEQVREFYRKNDYDEEARIRDFYKPGDDKIVFRKVLTPAYSVTRKYRVKAHSLVL